MYLQKSVFFGSVLVLGTLFGTRVASAAITSGCVAGRINYYENEGNYCDEDDQGQDCTDTTYRTGHYNTARRVKFAEVRVYGEYNGGGVNTLLGTGTTNTYGQFTIQWTGSSQPEKLKYQWRPIDRNGNFSVLYPSGNVPVFWCKEEEELTPQAGKTCSNPQVFDDMTVGSEGDPNAYANVYAGARRMWDSLNDSNTLMDLWEPIEILVGANVGSGWYGDENKIGIHTSLVYANQGAIAHEMGHAASHFLNPRRQTNDYCYPDKLLCSGPGGGCWDYNQDGITQNYNHMLIPWGGDWLRNDAGEWAEMAFEEGFATFLADTSIYGQDNPEPTSCGTTTTPCDADLNHDEWSPWVEKSQGLGMAVCQDHWIRSEFMVNRYLRDVYDNSNDSNSCNGRGATCQWGTINYNENTSRSLDEMLRVITLFSQGYGNHQNEEVYSGPGDCDIDNLDGHGTYDYVWNYLYASGAPEINTNLQRNWNCLPP